MRICFVCNEYPPAPHGGIGTFVRTLARRLADLGHAVAVVGWDRHGRASNWSQEQGISVLRLCPPSVYRKALRLGRYQLGAGLLGERISLSARVAAAARQFRADLIETYDWSGPLWRAPGRPLIVRLHGAHTAYAFYEGRRGSRLLRYFERRNVAMADALVAVSRHIGEVTLRALGLGERKFRVIYNGVDTALFSPPGVRPHSCEVLYAGSLSRRKGVFDLLEAAPLVKKRVPGARFSFAGALPPGGREALLRLVPDGVRDAISLLGLVPHDSLPALYGRAAVAVFPSRAEAFGLTCVEAMACGTPVVMTRLASGPELVVHGESGLLADPRNPQELAAAIVRLLQDAELRHRLGEAARRRAVEMFDSARIASENLRFYEEVLDGAFRS